MKQADSSIYACWVSVQPVAIGLFAIALTACASSSHVSGSDLAEGAGGSERRDAGSAGVGAGGFALGAGSGGGAQGDVGGSGGGQPDENCGCKVGAAWAVEPVNATDATAYLQPSLAADASNKVWASFLGSQSMSLLVAGRLADCDWTTEPVDSTSGFYDRPSLAIDASNTPWVSYKFSPGGSYEHIKVASRSSSGGWTSETVDSLGDFEGFWGPALAVDAASKVWVSYSHYDGLSEIETLNVASRWPGGAWTIETADSRPVEWSYGWNHVAYRVQSLAVDSAGKIWLSYIQQLANSSILELKVTSRSPGGEWTTETVDSNLGDCAYNHFETSLFVDGSNNVWVSYSGLDGENNALKMATRLASGGGWMLGTVESTSADKWGACFGEPSVAVDALNKLWVSFTVHDDTTFPKVARRSPGDSGWTTETMDASLLGGVNSSSLTVDASNRAWVSFDGGGKVAGVCL